MSVAQEKDRPELSPKDEAGFAKKMWKAETKIKATGKIKLIELTPGDRKRWCKLEQRCVKQCKPMSCWCYGIMLIALHGKEVHPEESIQKFASISSMSDPTQDQYDRRNERWARNKDALCKVKCRDC